jgi:hypothetical protein
MAEADGEGDKGLGLDGERHTLLKDMVSAMIRPEARK